MLDHAGVETLYGRVDAAKAAVQPLSQRDARMNLFLWLLLVATNVIDVLGTGRAFDFGIGELNPIVAGLHAQFGMAGLISFKMFFLSLLFFLLPHVRTWTRALFVAVCSAYVALSVAHVWFLFPLT